MKRLSIIVPMYNVESYIERCILSLEDQDIPCDDYEIICINDGSPDDCSGIVKQLQKKFDNILLIDQENKGVSQARNTGIDNANGEYILFIDADDYVDANSLARVLRTKWKQEIQVSFLGFTILDVDGKVIDQVFNENLISKVYTGIEGYSIARHTHRIDPDRIYAVLLDAGFINKHKLRFLPDVPYLEDGEFISRILCLAERCIFDGHSFYQRTTRPGSATNSNLFISEKATNGFLLAASNLKRFQNEQNLNQRQKDFLNQPVCKFVVLVITSAGTQFSFRRIGKVNKKLREYGLDKLNLDAVDSEYTKLGFLYNRSVYLLLMFQLTLNKIRFLVMQLKKRE